MLAGAVRLAVRESQAMRQARLGGLWGLWQDPERQSWFAARGFLRPQSPQLLPASLRSSDVLVKPLGKGSGEEAEAAIAAYAEDLGRIEARKVVS